MEIAIYSVGSAKLKQKHIHREGIPVEVIPFNADRVFLRVLKAYRFKTPFSLNYGQSASVLTAMKPHLFHIIFGRSEIDKDFSFCEVLKVFWRKGEEFLFGKEGVGALFNLL